MAQAKNLGVSLFPSHSRINHIYRLWPFFLQNTFLIQVLATICMLYPWSRSVPLFSWTFALPSWSLCLHCPFRVASVIFLKHNSDYNIPMFDTTQGFPLQTMKFQHLTMSYKTCILWRTLSSLTLSPSTFPIFSRLQTPGLLFVPQNISPQGF